MTRVRRQQGLGFKAASFAAIGVLNSLVDLGVFSIAYWYFQFSLVLSNIVAWTVAVTCSYVLNSLTTFARESGRELHLKAYFSFATSQVAGLGANTATVFLASYFVPVLAGKVVAIGASFLINFLLSNFVVFRSSDRSRPATKWTLRPVWLTCVVGACLVLLALIANMSVRHHLNVTATDISSRSRVTPTK
jgi:putative flippase GtrA